MKVGSIVELVDDRWKESNYHLYKEFPKKGIVYTVRSLRKSEENYSDVVICLEEIVNPIHALSNNEFGFRGYRFRELLPPIANIEEHINENTLEEERV